VSQPANCTGVIGVTAHTINGDNATYANIGPEVAISAPGGGPPSRLALQPLDESTTGFYVWVPSMFGATTQDSPFTATDTRSGPATAGLTGTSPAAAQVSGAVALLLSVDPSLSAQQVRVYLTSTARPHPAGSYCVSEATAINRCGSGLLDVGAAVNAAYQARQQADAARGSGGGGGSLPLAPVLLLVALGLARRLWRR
jgi:serine protease